MSNLNGASILSSITAGLMNTYSQLSNNSANGVTLESISDARTNANLNSTLNQNFASYIQTNFTSLDSDKDGILSSAELSNLTNMMSTQGMTAAQLTQLGAASGLPTAALEQVLAHFNQIDENKDGKVTTAEISAFNLTSAKEKKQLEFAHKAASNMSIYYADENASSSSSSSLLNYRYMNDDANTSS